MNTTLKTIKTETLNDVSADLIALESEVSRIIKEYGGLNLNSIVAMYHRFSTQIEVNGDTLFEARNCYADTKSFGWNGDPATIQTVRLGDYKKHLTYIYLAPKDSEHNDYIRKFDIGYEDDRDQWGDEITLADFATELKTRSRVVPVEVVDTAKKMFTDLLGYLKANNFSLCYDEDNDAVFIGPKDMAWNVSHIPSEPGSLRDPKLRKFVTNEMINRYAEEGHIASEAICHVHISDPDDTFSGCDLTYAV